MKKVLVGVFSWVIMTQSAFAVSLPPSPTIGPVVPMIGGGQGNSLVLGQTGDLNINQVTQDNTRIAEEVIRQVTNAQQIDLDYLKSIAERLNGHLEVLSQLKQRFRQMSLESQAMRVVELEQYLNLINEIGARDQVLRNELQTQTVITRESLPSSGFIEVGNTRATIARSGDINFQPLTSRVDALRVAMLTEMNGYQFPNMRARTGQPASVTANALTPNLGNIRVLTSEEITEKTNRVQELLTLHPNTTRYVHRYVDVAVTQITNYIRDYGVEEWLRGRDSGDMQARDMAFRGLADGFRRRSYARRRYRTRLGAIQTVDYDKSLGEVENLTYQPMLHALKNMRREAATTEDDVKRAYENARNWVDLYEKKLGQFDRSDNRYEAVSIGELLKDPEALLTHAWRSSGRLARINAGINRLTGQTAATEALVMVMRLLLADATEEMFLYQDDVIALTNFHNTRFRSTEEARTEYNRWACSIDPFLEDIVVQQICGGRRAPMPQMTNGRSFSEIFNSLLLQLQNTERARRQEADFEMQLVQAALRAGQSGSGGQTGPGGDGALDMFR